MCGIPESRSHAKRSSESWEERKSTLIRRSCDQAFIHSLYLVYQVTFELLDIFRIYQISEIRNQVVPTRILVKVLKKCEENCLKIFM